MVLVGVHGIGNRCAGGIQAASARLSENWTTYLRAGLGRAGLDLDVSVDVSYYADDLAPELSQGSDDPEFLPLEVKDLVLSWAALLGAPDEVAHGRATRPIRAVLDWVARKYGYDHKLVEWFVARAFREVWLYLHAADSSHRDAARDRVAGFIRARQPRIVLAHSLGSVVAYEALCANPDLHVEALVTIGSPLGMPDIVYERLEPTIAGRRPRPAGVRRWHNIADHGDLIAIPMEGLRPLFDLDQDHPVSAGLFDFHRVSKYLASDRVAELVHELVTS